MLPAFPPAQRRVRRRDGRPVLSLPLLLRLPEDLFRRRGDVYRQVRLSKPSPPQRLHQGAKLAGPAAAAAMGTQSGCLPPSAPRHTAGPRASLQPASQAFLMIKGRWVLHPELPG